MPPPPAVSTAELGDLAQSGPKLVAAAALLVDDIAQEFGVPEMAQLSYDGQLRRHDWSYPQVITWAEETGSRSQTTQSPENVSRRKPQPYPR